MSNSPLVNCTVKSPNHSGARTKRITRITPHCVVGQLAAESIGGCFTSPNAQASCNYGIGTNGRVVLVVDEANRSWCSSSSDNDQRAVTIECASELYSPYYMNNKVYNKLVDLCVDICKRNGATKLLWFADKNTALNYQPSNNEIVLTVHRWFANKSCPGDWLFAALGNLASTVTARLQGAEAPQKPSSGSGTIPPSVSVSCNYAVKVDVNGLNIRSGPGTNNAINGEMPKGIYTIVAEATGAGASKWGKLKSGAGWISLDYVDKLVVQAISSYLVRVDAADLNMRSGPGTNNASLGYTGPGTFTIVEEADGPGATKWGKLKSGAGWIALDYATRL